MGVDCLHEIGSPSPISASAQYMLLRAGTWGGLSRDASWIAPGVLYGGIYRFRALANDDVRVWVGNC